MKIGIDISQTAFPGTGVAVYTENLVNNLLKIDKENEYLLFFSSLRGKSSIRVEQADKIKLNNWKIPPLVLEILWNKLHVLPIDLLMGSPNLLHTSDWLEPPAKCPKVTTVHDLSVFKYPEKFAVRGGHDIVENQKRKYAWVKKESKIIIAVSENTKADIINLLKIPPEKIRVVYEAADPIFSNQQSATSIQQVKDKYGIEGKYILAVGTREPRKNLDRAIEAFSQLTTHYPQLSLVIAGKYGWGSEMTNKKSQMTNVRILGYVPKENLACLYSGAECFIYPSLYEGFGLPVLEAMTCGCPVVTSNLSSMPEIAGKAAVLVNPMRIDDIGEGLGKAMKNRNKLSLAGFERIKSFSWEKTAEETLKVYKEVYADRN